MSAAQPKGSGDPKKVVVLGGGGAGAAIAFWLSAPEQNGAYDVTLYTQGWRLGGKCASGRNAGQGDRIEEHGLHMLMGCYQNAFATIRSCYEKWRRAPDNPFQTWQDAFLPQRQVTLMEQDDAAAVSGWSPWNFSDFPIYSGEPGDGPVTQIAALARMAPPRVSKPSDGPLIVRMVDLLEAHVQVPEHIRHDYMTALASLRHMVTSPTIDSPTDAMQKLGAVNQQLDSALQPAARRPVDHLAAAAAASAAGHRALILANLGVSIGFGYARDIRFGGPNAYDALNSQDFRQWLKGCGASDATLASAPIRAIYDLAFAFPAGAAGSIDNGSIAAGVTLRFVLELAFGYRDAPLWKMAAGMGDTVFTPFYQVLLARGVSVQFFSRVTELRPTADGQVGEIDISQQAKTINGNPYHPLVTVNDLDCWPNQPDWNQLENGPELQQTGVDFESSFCGISVGSRTLSVGTDFDIVVLAMPPDALKVVTAPLASASADWTTALDASRSVATQALQLWMRPTLANLGWGLGETVLTAFAEPYDSWADMSHLLSRETWSGAYVPQSIGYFCGCMEIPATGPINPGTMLLAATTQAEAWLESGIQSLWSTASPPPWSLPGTIAVSRYDRANFDISERYVQTPAGDNVASRFSSGQTAGFANLYVVGDWTKTRFSGGCFESTIESAMLAARAISGFPTQIQTS